MIWEKIRENPTIAAFEKVKKRLEAQTERNRRREDEKPDPDLVFEALKRALKKDKNKLFEFITPKNHQTKPG